MISRDVMVQAHPVTITLGLALNGSVSGNVSFTQDRTPDPAQGLVLLTQLPNGGLKVVATALPGAGESRVTVNFIMDWNTQRSFLAGLPNTTAFRVENKTRAYVATVGAQRLSSASIAPDIRSTAACW
ncbi:hypothetical protein [uncultured Sphingomonas sp.]|uniref:hypothetical protein n=1 Tax=uncultured Sphingomonas sp. TaxID=158754 RepID=UPI0035CAE630